MPNGHDFFTSHAQEIRELERKFTTYHSGIDVYDIRNWLNQFGGNKTIGLKLLNNIEYYSPVRVNGYCRELAQEFFNRFGEDLDHVFFVQFGHTAKSGESITTTFRRANSMRPARYQEKFINIAQIPTLFNLDTEFEKTKPPEEQDVQNDNIRYKIIFIDDFIGSGQQACDYYNNDLRTLLELTPEGTEYYLAVFIGYEGAISRVEADTELGVIAMTTLDQRHKIFSDACPLFTNEEKQILRDFCNAAGELPEGFNNVQSIVVFHYCIPNDSISILRSNNDRWRGLFPRYY